MRVHHGIDDMMMHAIASSMTIRETRTIQSRSQCRSKSSRDEKRRARQPEFQTRLQSSRTRVFNHAFDGPCTYLEHLCELIVRSCKVMRKAVVLAALLRRR